VAASDLDLTHIVSPLRKLLKRATFFQGEVLAIDPTLRVVTVRHGAEDAHCHGLEYDHLVLALGSSTNFFGIAGLAERSFTMKTLGDAIALRNRLLECLEQADSECCASVRAPLLTMVVAGGGFAGVETIGALNDFVRESLRFYRNLRPEEVRMVLVHPGAHLLPELGPGLGGYTAKQLGARGVEVRLGCKVTASSEQAVELSDGTRIAAKTLVWTAGTSPHPLLATIAAAKERGRLKVDEFLAVPGFQNVWALGDCAAVPDVIRGGFHPPTAQHATRMAKTLAHNLAAALGHGTRRPFRFRMLGQLAAIGRRSGVANLFGLRFSGFLAWWMWRTIYLAKLPRFERKLRVALDWTLDLMFSKDLVQCPTGEGPGTRQAAVVAVARAVEPVATSA
jgi:NADH dehydrogenase